jgi:hypothetical protein
MSAYVYGRDVKRVKGSEYFPNALYVQVLV